MIFARLARPLATFTFVLVMWEVVSRSGLVSAPLFPPPTRVVRALVDMAASGELAADLAGSLWRALAGFLIGCAVGVATGTVTGRSMRARQYLVPLLQVLRPLPPVAIVPLVIVWFGIGNVAKLFSIAFAVFFPVWLNTHLGTQGVPLLYIWSAESLGVRGRRTLLRVIIPAAAASIVAGIRSGAALAFVMVFVSELAGASEGIGYRIAVTQLAFRIDQMIASLGVLALCGFAFDAMIAHAVRWLCPWLNAS